MVIRPKWRDSLNRCPWKGRKTPRNIPGSFPWNPRHFACCSLRCAMLAGTTLLAASIGKETSMKSSPLPHPSTPSKSSGRSATGLCACANCISVCVPALHAPKFQHALLYLQAILSDIPRKNGWQIAEQARQARPYGMQRLLSRAVWDQDGVRDDLRTLVCQTLCPPSVLPEQEKARAPFPVLVIDESCFPKRGRHSAGVGPPVLRAHRACGKLPGRCLPLLRHRAGSCPHRPRVVPARRLVRRSAPQARRSYSRSPHLSHQTRTGQADAQACSGRRTAHWLGGG